MEYEVVREVTVLRNKDTWYYDRRNGELRMLKDNTWTPYGYYQSDREHHCVTNEGVVV